MTARVTLPFEIALLASLLLHTLAFLLWWYPIKLINLSGTTPAMAANVGGPMTITFYDVEEPQSKPKKKFPWRTFMETDPSQVTGEEPENAKYYSDKPTTAANPDNPTGMTRDTPYLDGEETRIRSTENVPPDAPAATPPMPVPTPPRPEPKVAETHARP